METISFICSPDLEDSLSLHTWSRLRIVCVCVCFPQIHWRNPPGPSGFLPFYPSHSRQQAATSSQTLPLLVKLVKTMEHLRYKSSPTVFYFYHNKFLHVPHDKSISLFLFLCFIYQHILHYMNSLPETEP